MVVAVARRARLACCSSVHLAQLPGVAREQTTQGKTQQDAVALDRLRAARSYRIFFVPFFRRVKRQAGKREAAGKERANRLKKPHGAAVSFGGG